MRLGLVFAALLFATTPASAGVVEAKYSEPTKRYGHAILGDAIEFGSLHILTDAGAELTLTLPQTRVFEDLEPRLSDVDLDGDNEVIVIETSIAQGARLAIYDESGLVAATPYIGRTHRWLAPIGAGDLDGDGFVELAYIDRPHLAKTLRVWRFKDGALTHVVDQAGLTNHRIGDDFITGGLRSCDDRLEMVTVNANWSRVTASRLEGGRIATRNIGPYKGRSSTRAALSCQ